jgi:NitT/TauT family transport system ATP-binding protein
MSVSAGPLIALSGVRYAYGAVPVLEDLTFTVAPREFVAVVGPSGCGKSTLLSLLSGEMAPHAGTVERRGPTRTVFQADGLFPWQTVRQNLALGLGPTDAQSSNRLVGEMLALIRLEEFGDHYPHQLSGGMRQRVEIARALIGPSDALLLDEPFSALDYLTRLRMRSELARLIAERPRAVVLVTHDIEEAAQLADRILLLSDRPARIRQVIDLRDAPPAPRDPTDPAVVETTRRILECLRDAT